MAGTQEALQVAFCDTQAARYACEHWHYSAKMPAAGGTVTFGVWEGRFIGAVVFSKGPGGITARAIRYGLERVEACELARVALTKHKAPVTQIVAEALRQLKKVNPGLRLVISYADPRFGHHGGIYQAGNWTYVGLSGRTLEYRVDGKWRHNRTVHGIGQQMWMSGSEQEHARYNDWLHTLPRRYQPAKHVYLWAFDKKVRRAIEVDAVAYPTAEQVSEARHRRSSVEGQVRSLGSAP